MFFRFFAGPPTADEQRLPKPEFLSIPHSNSILEIEFSVRGEGSWKRLTITE